MLPLIPLAVSLLPDLAKWVFGSGAEKPAAAVAQVVQRLTGTDDPAAAQAAIEASPDLARQLRVDLARIAAEADQAQRTAELEALKATLADVQSARAQTVDLARAGSGVQWAPVLISIIVLVSFAVVVWVVLTRQIPDRSEALANVLMGTLGAMATAVVNYWVGSSAGSAAKNALIMSKAEGK